MVVVAAAAQTREQGQGEGQREGPLLTGRKGVGGVKRREMLE